MSTFVIIHLLIVILSFTGCLCWSQDELDLFDLVEEVNQDFYSFLEVEKDASVADIRKAYRKLSLQYHPDKNRDDPNAAENFRKIGAVAEVLKDEQKREMYNNVLEFGLPDWKQPVYYYRKVRKMGLVEMSILLFIIVIIGQFLYGWALYFEKQLVLYELRQRKDKKDRKSSKGRKNPSMTLEAQVLYYEALAKDALPHYSKLLPCLIVKWIFLMFQYLIYTCWRLYQSWKYSKAKKDDKPVRQTRNDKIVDSTVEDRTEHEQEAEEDVIEEDNNKPNSENDDLIVEMIDKQEEERLFELELEREKELEEELKALEENIEEQEDEGKDRRHRRNKKAHSTKIKSHLSDKSLEYYNSQDNGQTEHDAIPPPEPNGKVQLHTTNSDWNQYQQKQLEWALTNYEKDKANRWELVAKAVPGKSKEECISRYKELVELLRKRKSQ